jgi:hypothetical protein
VRARGLVDPVFVPEIEELNETLSHLVRGGDIVVTMGAGDIGGAAGRLHDFLCGQAEQPCLLYTSPSPRDRQKSRMPSSA